MSFEVETKVLDVDFQKIKRLLTALGAKKILDTKFIVDWYQVKGTKSGEEEWFLRIRTDGNGNSEITWKGKSKSLGKARKHEEINIKIVDPKLMGDLFLAIGLEHYAHQEKLRTSWTYKDWRFDLDTYPGMPPYLEIEGKNEKHIQEAISLLKLNKHQALSEGETKIIREIYKLNWNDMGF